MISLQRAATLLFALAATAARASAADKSDSGSAGGVAKAKSPPPFFLQDGKDGMCLGGDEFKRCALDTLFFVVGSPGSYQIHLRPSSDEDNTELCVSHKSCDGTPPASPSSILTTPCTHCGAKTWNILGDATTGYVLSSFDGKICVYRSENSKAMVASCESTDIPYTPLQLQFATKEDIDAMSSAGARLVAAATDGDVKAVKKMIASGDVKVNDVDWDEITGLIPSASNGDEAMTKVLVELGADVNMGDKDGITPLMEAAIMGHLKISQILIEAGAELDAKTNSGVTALWLASGEGKVEVMKYLFSKGADATVTRSDGITALMSAAANGHVEATTILLKEGADPLAKDKDGLNALMNAAENGTLAVLEALISHAPDDSTYVDGPSDAGFTALIVSAAHGHTEVVEFLISKGADVDFMHQEAVTALMYAAAGGHVATAKSLIDAGAVVNKLHSNLGSALLEAATAGSAEAMELLIDSGADVALADKDGVTAVMSAASQGHYPCTQMLIDVLKKTMTAEDFTTYINKFSESGGSAVMFSAGAGKNNVTQILIDSGADINAIAQATPEYLDALAEAIEKGTLPEDQEPHVDGVTALHVAAQGGHLDTIQLLIEAGAEVEVKDEEDRSALLLAVKGNYGEVASMLVQHGADPNTPYVDDEGESHNLLMDAIIVENIEFAVLLIQNGADIGNEDEHKVSTLLQASHRGLTEVVKALLEKNSDKEYLNKPSDEGITPLIAASSEGHLDIVMLLLGVNAEVDAKDEDQTTAVMAASARGHIPIAEALIAAKADVNLQNVDGHTALMFAYNGKSQVETLFERYRQFVDETQVENDSSQKMIGGSEVEEQKDDDLVDGGTGPIIEEALKNHTNLVDMLLKAGADDSLKDKEGHAAKDFDFKPDTDPEILEREELAQSRRDDSKNEL